MLPVLVTFWQLSCHVQLRFLVALDVHVLAGSLKLLHTPVVADDAQPQIMNLNPADPKLERDPDPK